ADAPAAAAELEFPVVVKPNVGGSGAGILRFDTPTQLAAAAATGGLELGPDHTALVQEFIPSEEGRITRVEVLGGRFLYAIRVYSSGETFNLCPADVCQTTEGAELVRSACPVDAPRNGLRVEGYEPPLQFVREVERMEAEWSYVRRLARASERAGFDLTLIAELNLNDIKGPDAPALDAWSTAAALAAVTDRLELMVAVRPTFHPPALLAKQAANIDHISGGRLSLNVVSSWWAEEAKQYGVEFDTHDARYARTAEWLTVVDGLWSERRFSFTGTYYRVDDAILEPKPIRRPRPTLYAGGESPAAKSLNARACDGYLMHGDPPER